jgi:6-phosphogluconolactonase
MEKKIFDSPEAVSVELSKYLIKKINEKILKGGRFSIALSGGNTPKLFYHTLSRSPFKDEISWEKIEVFWGDERCVPPDDEQSNYGMAKYYLLDKVGLKKENIHRMKGENEPPAEAERYAEEIKQVLSVDGNNLAIGQADLPILDFMLQGIGEDGHTASLFPNQDLDHVHDNICGVGDRQGQKRISLTYDVINNASNVSFLVTGKEKAVPIHDVIVEKKDLPSARIKPKQGELIWWLDKEAASRLTE